MTNYFIIRAASCCKEIFIKFPLSITSVKFKSFSFLQYSKKTPLEEMNMPFYYLGVSIANEVLSQNSLKSILNHEEMGYLIQGFSNTLLGTKCLDISYSASNYGEKVKKIIEERSAALLNRTKMNGKEYISKYLENNNGAILTEMGLVYHCISQGNGVQPNVENTVEVHYHGTLIDGTVVDTSVTRRKTILFPLGNVIKGWQVGLTMMKVGGKSIFIIPSELAYGDVGNADVIPPGSTLKFVVELFHVS